MKNILVIGLVSSLLFSASLAMSLWLQSTKATAATAGEDKDHKKKADGQNDEHKTDDHGPKSKSDDHAATDHKPTDPKSLAVGPSDADRLDLRRSQMEVVLKDLRGQREQYEALARQVSAEVKAALALADAQSKKADPEPASPVAGAVKPAGGPAKPTAQEEAEEKQKLARIGSLIEQMPPEKAAEIIQTLADNGNMDTAVKILLAAQQRSAAKVLASIPDPALSAQFVEKMRAAKPPGR